MSLFGAPSDLSAFSLLATSLPKAEWKITTMWTSLHHLRIFLFNWEKVSLLLSKERELYPFLLQGHSAHKRKREKVERHTILHCLGLEVIYFSYSCSTGKNKSYNPPARLENLLSLCPGSERKLNEHVASLCHIG